MKSLILLAALVQAPEPGPDLTSDEQCFLRVFCAAKRKIQYGKDSWTPEQCDAIGRQVVRSARRHGLQPGFGGSFAIHESDLREGVVRATVVDVMDVHGTHKAETAHDGGLMGIHCVHDPIEPPRPTDDPAVRKLRLARYLKKRDALVCKNEPVRGFSFSQIMQPLDGEDGAPGNVELGFRELAKIRDGGVHILGTRIEHGRVVRTVKKCPHRTHPFWAHYQWGSQEQGKSRFYGHSVASIYKALADAMGVGTPELDGVVLYVDGKGRRHYADRPLTPRHRALYAKIMECRGTCRQVAVRRRLGLASR